VVAEAGWKRICPACRAEHFPRTDPVTIMLPTFGDSCLLGRQAAWPPGRFSTLAGFMEPGESIEAACAREVKEEAGLTVVAVRYHSSQPWPFPCNLMIGLIAEVSDQQAAPDQTELEEVRWFTRPELRRLLRGEIEGLGAPPPWAVAHQLMKAWADAGT
jgi:NAD+ diphosphatase